MSPSPCFGIDLGTTCSAIGLVRDGVPRILPVDGTELLPSAVLYPKDGDPLVGQPALNALPLHPERGILSSKRLMGSDHRYDLGDRQLTPVDVAAVVLQRLIQAAQTACGIRPERAVITVPAWFTQAQRADTRAAGKRAGLQVARIINEPTAAALAHAHGQDLRRRVLVYDLGGGTFDVSLVEQDGPVVEVRASHGDSRLGGDDIDLALVDLVLRRLAETDRALRDAVDASVPARVRLLLAVEQAKIALSETDQVTLRVPFLLEMDGTARHLELPLSRMDVDDASEPFLRRTITSVDQVLADAAVKPGDIEDLLLVGGSTLQPRVWHMLHQRYGLEGSHAISPRRAVVLGAAIQGAIVDGSRTDGILVDVAPYSLSIGHARGPMRVPTHFVCTVVTPRNAPLPSRHTEILSTAVPRQKTVTIPVFQGAHIDPRRNTILGRILLKGLPPAPQGRDSRPIRVEFRHDLDGMVHIEVTDVLSGRSAQGQVAADGAEQEQLREDVQKVWEHDHLIPGDGSDWDQDEPWSTEPWHADPSTAGHETDLGAPDAAEAAAVFRVVLDARER
ncbi:MAG: Hsp70 family protein, partial [Oligoflexia bacterium]|nr:Hsp70 family protein [Oligoflexia bacterium]